MGPLLAAACGNGDPEFTAYYHGERHHQGLGNNIIEPGSEVGRTEGGTRHGERMGGMLSYHHREAT